MKIAYFFKDTGRAKELAIAGRKNGEKAIVVDARRFVAERDFRELDEARVDGDYPEVVKAYGDKVAMVGEATPPETTRTPAEDFDLDRYELSAEYKRLTGEEPDGRWKAKRILSEIERLEPQPKDD